jgi:antitoxin YefM
MSPGRVGEAQAKPTNFLDRSDRRCHNDLNSGQPKRRSIRMKTLSLSEAKMKLSGLIETLRVTDEEIMITKNGAPAAVLISPDEFESWKETISIRSDSSLMGEIQKGLKEMKEKKSRLYSLDELFE